MPYNPLALPYIINTKELPANQSAAAQVPAAIVSASQWSQSPTYTPNWGSMMGPANSPPPGPQAPNPPYQATSPVATCSVTWPDAIVDDRDQAANLALNNEKNRLTGTGGVAPTATAQANAISAILAGAVSIASVSPNSISHTAAPVTLTIQGGNFSTGAPTVTVQGVACTAVTVVNDGELTCLSPATGLTATPVGGPGANVVVTIGANSATLAGAMTIT